MAKVETFIKMNLEATGLTIGVGMLTSVYHMTDVIDPEYTRN